MARKPKRLTKDQKKIAELHSALAATEQQCERYKKHYNEEVAARGKAETSEKEARRQFAELKERLHHSETERAKLRGVINRVDREDDLRERSALIAAGKSLPQEAPPLMHDRRPDEGPRITRHVNYGDGAPRHWTDY